MTSPQQQISYLKDVGLMPPPDPHACQRLVLYLERGNGTIGTSSRARIRIARRLQDLWVGKAIRVLSSDPNHNRETGTVEYLEFLSPEDVAEHVRTYNISTEGREKLAPAKAAVKFPGEIQAMLYFLRALRRV